MTNTNCDICTISDTITEATHTCEDCGYRVCRGCTLTGGQYFIDHARIDEAGKQIDGRDKDGGCPWCGRDCPDAGKPEGCWYQGCPDFPHGE